MNMHIAFLRAINVAGHGKVKMEDMRQAFSKAGCENVRTYIQSGNVIFQSAEENLDAIKGHIQNELKELLGSEVTVLFRTQREISNMVKKNFFKDIDKDVDIKLYVTFLSRHPEIQPKFPLHLDKEALDVIGMENLDVFTVSRRKKNGFYGFPNNFIEKEFGVLATSRNWNTVLKIAESIS